MMLYAEHLKQPGGALSSFLLYPCTIHCNNLWGHRLDGQRVSMTNEWKEGKKQRT